MATYYAGQPVLATTFASIEARMGKVYTKSGVNTYTSNTTLTNDPDFTCAMEANSTYIVEIQGSIGGTDGDIQTSWSAPTNSSGSKQCVGPALSSTDRTDTNMRAGNHAFATAVPYGTASATSLASIQEIGRVVTIEAGTFVWQHAQNSSTVNPSNIGVNSIMRVTKIS